MVIALAALPVAAWLAFTLRRVLLVLFAGFVLAPASFMDRVAALVEGWALGQATLCASVGLST